MTPATIVLWLLVLAVVLSGVRLAWRVAAKSLPATAAACRLTSPAWPMPVPAAGGRAFADAGGAGPGRG